MTEPTMTSGSPEAGRACANCGADMERHQDWCLECGVAAPGRLGAVRPGWRAVGTTLALTLALVGGAGAASYAALSSDATREAIASVPADATPVPQAPPAVPAPAAPVTPAPAVPPAAPPVTPPAAKLPVAPAPTVVVPPAPTPKAPAAPAAPRTTTAPSTPRSTPPAAGPRGAGTSAGGSGSAPDRVYEPVELGAGAVSVYDPYGRSVAPGDPAEAVDGDPGTTFEVGAPDDDRELQLGVLIDLEAAKQVRAVELTTSTPGGRLELYATDGSALPPDILDTRWDHPASRSKVAGKERIVLPRGGEKYRYVVLWITKPATGTRRFGVSELALLG